MKTSTCTLALALLLPLASQAGERVYAFDLAVDADGRVERITPQVPDARAAELAAQLRQWRFEPAASAGPARSYLRVVAREDGEGMRILDASTGPRPLALPAPVYPDADQRRGREGVVVLRLDVDASGAVTAAHVHATGGDVSRGMGEAALQAVQAWRFEPERVAGRPVGTQLLMPVCFASDPGEAMCRWQGPDARRRGAREAVSLQPVLRASASGSLVAGR